MVKEGTVKLGDKQGNDRADTVAGLGATSSQAKVQAFGRLYSCRQLEYRTLMCRIQRFIVALKEEERKLKDEIAKHRKLTTPEAEMKVTIPKHLSYHDLPCMEPSSPTGPLAHGCAGSQTQMVHRSTAMHVDTLNRAGSVSYTHLTLPTKRIV